MRLYTEEGGVEEDEDEDEKEEEVMEGKCERKNSADSPMDEPQLMYRLNSKHTFRHVKLGHVLAEDVVLHQHCH